MLNGIFYLIVVIVFLGFEVGLIYIFYEYFYILVLVILIFEYFIEFSGVLGVVVIKV